MSRIQSNHDRDTGSVELAGRLDAYSVPSLLTSIDAWLDQPGQTLHVNLGHVEHADSAGVAFLLETQRRAQSADKSVAFINAPAQMHAIIGFCALDRVLALQ